MLGVFFVTKEVFESFATRIGDPNVNKVILFDQGVDLSIKAITIKGGLKLNTNSKFLSYRRGSLYCSHFLKFIFYFLNSLEFVFFEIASIFSFVKQISYKVTFNVAWQPASFI